MRHENRFAASSDQLARANRPVALPAARRADAFRSPAPAEDQKFGSQPNLGRGLVV